MLGLYQNWLSFGRILNFLFKLILAFFRFESKTFEHVKLLIWMRGFQISRRNKSRSQDFPLGIFSGFSRFSSPDPDSRDLGIFRNLHSIRFFGIFSRFYIPIPGVSGYLGFFTGIFVIFISRSQWTIWIPNPRYRDSGSRKNPIPKPSLSSSVKLMKKYISKVKA